MVRPVRAASQVTRCPRAKPSARSPASSGSTPMTRTCGAIALMAAAIPLIRPPPLTGTQTEASSGTSSTISSTDRALPGDDVGVVERRDEDRAGLGLDLLDPGRTFRQLHELDPGPVSQGREPLHIGGLSGHHHGGPDPRLAGGSGQRLRVVAGRVRHDPSSTFLRIQHGYRVSRAPRLERPGDLQVLRLEQQRRRRRTKAGRDDRGTADQTRDPFRCGVDLGQPDEALTVHATTLTRPRRWHRLAVLDGDYSGRRGD